MTNFYSITNTFKDPIPRLFKLFSNVAVQDKD